MEPPVLPWMVPELSLQNPCSHTGPLERWLSPCCPSLAWFAPCLAHWGIPVNWNPAQGPHVVVTPQLFFFFVLQRRTSNQCLVSVVLGKRVGWRGMQAKKKEERGRVITHPKNQAVQGFRNLNTLFQNSSSKNAEGREPAGLLAWTDPNRIGGFSWGKTVASRKGEAYLPASFSSQPCSPPWTRRVNSPTGPGVISWAVKPNLFAEE